MSRRHLTPSRLRRQIIASEKLASTTHTRSASPRRREYRARQMGRTVARRRGPLRDSGRALYVGSTLAAARQDPLRFARFCVAALDVPKTDPARSDAMMVGMTDPPDVHPEIAHLRFLLGHWVGTGSGHYPTIDDFGYREQVWFEHVGKPFISYRQGTRHAGTGLPLHAESGYLRPVGTDRVELVVAQPSGIVEVHEGTVDGTTLRLRSTSVLTTPTAKTVTAVERDLRIAADQLDYDVSMAAVGLELQHHLNATLTRQG